MSSGRWSDKQLSAAFHAGTALIGGERYLWGTDEPAPNRTLRALCYVAESHSLEQAIQAWTGMLGSEPAARCDGTLLHFCRRVREALGVDEPVWKRMLWESAPNADDSFFADAGTAKIEVAFARYRPANATYEWHGLLTVGAEETARATGQSRDEVSSALHDALVSFHIAGLRSATAADWCNQRSAAK